MIISKFDELVRAYADKQSRFFFLQIGANDGKIGDPLYALITEYGWHGVLVEPQRQVFEQRLLNNYSHQSNLVFENVAMDKFDGERELYSLSFSNKRWATGLSSFKRSHLQHHIDNGYVDRMIGDERDQLPSDPSEWILSETVRTMSFQTLLAKHQISALDLLQMDTEGYDYQLLKLFDFEQLKPKIIQFEMHVMAPHERQESLDYLAHYDYVCFKDYINYVAVQREVVADLGIEIVA